MPRTSLLERVRTRLNDRNFDLPLSFQAGTDSLLQTLSELGKLDSTELVDFLVAQTGHQASRASAQELERHAGELGERGVYVLVGQPHTFAVVRPHDTLTIDELVREHGPDLRLELVSSLESKHQEETHPEQTMIDDQEVVQGILDNLDESETDVEVVNSHDLTDDGAEIGDEAPIIRLLNMILLRAFKEGASDIHIEAEESVTRVRYRVDGELREVLHPPKKFHNAIVSRVKIMSDLDIAEKRSPQDGRMKLKLGEENMDVRVSTIPSVDGEKVVMRVLHEGSLLLDLDDIGFTEAMTEVYRGVITRPYGIILVTGPTGSGKTTTLYSTLRFLNSNAKNIITIEDPVEYQVENINQIQVNRRAGIDFASGLKSILRQDPDIIMVGEMRDEETASMAVKAALTGHLVFSTLHTNDAPGCYERLQDMNVPPYLLTSAIIGVVAQRLVRRNCPRCLVPDHPDDDLMRFVGFAPGDFDGLRRGAGCSSCGGTGYRGRTGVYELLTPSQEVKKRVLAGTMGEGTEISGYEPMVVHGRSLAKRGVTSVEALCKVVRCKA